ncbi:MAG TPA: YdcH family protein [Stellaceae bacterium]|nr:YdcH family protein [Stellaceae bacterium]
MAVEDRIRSLRDKHAQLDQEIMRESARSLPDAVRVAECKRAKLRIKDTIVDLERSH